MGPCCTKDINAESSAERLSFREEEFLSSRKMKVILAADKPSCFKFISDEFEEKFGRPIDEETLRNYYDSEFII